MKPKILPGLAFVVSIMKNLKRDRLFATLVLAMAVTPSPVHAKWVDFGAHFDREDYWNSHAIYLARITDIKNPAAANAPFVTSFEPIKIISGSIDATNRSIQSSPGQAVEGGPTGEYPVEFPAGVHTGAEMLVSEDLRRHQATVVRVMVFPEDQALLVVLEQIARLRQAPALQTLLANTTSEFDLLSGYCLNRLLAWPDQTIPNNDLKKLQSVAGDGERPANLRIAAEEAALRFSGIAESGRSEAEYDWLRGVIQAGSQSPNANTNRQVSWDQMEPIVYKLFEIRIKWGETADYILRLVSDENAPTSLRTAACSALSSWDEQVFNFQSPDKRFDRMVNTYVDLLSDKSPELRIMGMSMLFDRTVPSMAMRSPPDRTKECTQKAVQALQKAMVVETNSRVMLYFKSRMAMHEDEEKHPERFRQMHELEMRSSGTNGRSR
ncbi:MAG: hypothetical protein ABSG04_06125 [Verrucomicrobiota bacterium]|jgi:hypothetical protein